jgi:cytochrome c oxidase subunit 4
MEAHMEHAQAQAAVVEHQEHPLGVYFRIWILLFVLSSMSYAVDYFQFQGYLRWSLIIVFMLLKAGFIVSIFMHMWWERMALAAAILMPPLCLLVLIGIMSIEGDFTYDMRDVWMGQDTTLVAKPPAHMAH